MEKNKTEKYFKYAIGEIVLVVIGILIALQINNWNSNRIQKQKERLLLNALNKEFKSNRIQLDSVLTKHKYSMKSVDYLMSRLPINNIKIENLDSLSYHIYHLGTYYTFNPSGGVINSLMNSSSINIITNNELRQFIIGWNEDRRFDLDNILNNSYGELDDIINTIDKIIELSEAKNND